MPPKRRGLNARIANGEALSFGNFEKFIEIMELFVIFQVSVLSDACIRGMQMSQSGYQRR